MKKVAEVSRRRTKKCCGISGKGRASALSVVKSVSTYLTEKHVPFATRRIGAHTIFTGRLSGFEDKFGGYDFCIVAGQISVASYAIMPFVIPRKDRGLVSELIARLNFCLMYGQFELDFNDGELRFKLRRSAWSISCDRDSTLDQILALPAAMLHRYQDAFLGILNGKKTPEGAFRSCVG